MWRVARVALIAAEEGEEDAANRMDEGGFWYVGGKG